MTAMKKFTLLYPLVTLILLLALLFTADAQKKYTVFVAFINGEKVKGKLIRATQDSLSILNALNSKVVRMGASEIKSIRVRKKGSICRGIGIGAGAGAIAGALIGYSSREQISQGCSAALYCIAAYSIEYSPVIADGILGALTGSLLGAGAGSIGKKFQIEGNQVQFELFANEFKNKGSSPKSNKQP